MEIRLAGEGDTEDIKEIYLRAIAYMRENGNNSQWEGAFSPVNTTEKDIKNGQCYVGVDENDKINFVFVFIVGEDPTYQKIVNGEWLNRDEYGAIHRVASAGLCGGVMRYIVDFCFGKIQNLKCDTHSDNVIMQKQLTKCGFKECGIIYAEDGSERLAYQKAGA